MQESILVRPRVDGDIPSLVAVLQDVHVNDQWPLCRPDDWATWLVVSNELQSWVAELDGDAIGHVSLQSPPASALMVPHWVRATGLQADQMIEITRLFASPLVRGMGVGRALLDSALESVSSTQLTPVLYTSEIDVAAQKVYERSGWKRVGESPEVLPNGTTLVMIAYVQSSAAS